MPTVSDKRMCSRFYCDYRGDRYCCRDCWHNAYCTNPCLNDPSRCGLEDKGTKLKTGNVSIVKT